MKTSPPWHLSAYALGELAPPEAASFEAHLGESPEARAELDALERVLPVVAEAARRRVKRRKRRRVGALVAAIAIAAAISLFALRPDRVALEITAPAPGPDTGFMAE